MRPIVCERSHIACEYELASVFTIGDNSVFLDAEQRTQVAQGNPKELREHSDVPKVRTFLRRGE